MPPTRRSESAPRRSSRVTDLEKAATSAQKQAAALANKAKKEAAAAARKAAQASKKTKKVVRRNVVKPAARAVAKAAGVAVDDKPKQKRKAPTDRSEGATEAKKQKTAEEKKVVKKTPKAAAADGKVKVGQVVPDVTLRDEEDKEVSLKTLYDEAPLVIFSYPKADTPGCTTQACLYRDSVKEGAFAAVGYTVLGLSRDKPTAQNKWKTKHTLGYTLLSDPDGELLSKLGQTADKKRCHWVIEKGGTLLAANHGVKPADDAKNALAFIKSLAPGSDEKDTTAAADEKKDE